MALLGAAPSAVATPQTVLPPVSVIPMPRDVQARDGAYEWRSDTRIGAESANERSAANVLAAYLRTLGLRPAVVAQSTADRAVSFRTLTPVDPELGSEGYTLRVDAGGVAITANTAAGLFYAVQTLEQLTPQSRGAAVQTRFVAIGDRPQYAWRGIHLDVSRHFFSVPTIKRYIDVASRYKLNVFHWHLTDDEGWRIEIKSRPLLTRTGGCGLQGGCGYYTHADIADVVQYADERHVTIVPEIDVPGHSGAALAAYPELSCGVVASPKVYCPTERTFAFLEDVLTEIVRLFPGRFVHIGGDEVSSREWRSSSAVRRLMQREHLSTYAGVQGYITARLARFLEKNGRRAVAWDEVLAAPVPASVVVMAWRGPGVLDLAARSGHEVISTPDGPLYFDAYQGEREQEPRAMRFVSTLQEVYAHDPARTDLLGARAAYVIGAQANLWTEEIATPDHLFYMLLPRELALAEVAWTPPVRKSWPSFNARLPSELGWLVQHGYRFRIPDVAYSLSGEDVRFAAVPGRIDSAVAETASPVVRVALASAAPGPIRYTTDGSAPTSRSALFRMPFDVHVSPGTAVAVKAAAFLGDGSRGAVSTCTIRRAPSRAPRRSLTTFPTWSDLVSSRRADVYTPPPTSMP